MHGFGVYLYEKYHAPEHRRSVELLSPLLVVISIVPPCLRVIFNNCRAASLPRDEKFVLSFSSEVPLVKLDVPERVGH
jgi:hypothetical protein